MNYKPETGDLVFTNFHGISTQWWMEIVLEGFSRSGRRKTFVVVGGCARNQLFLDDLKVLPSKVYRNGKLIYKNKVDV